MGQLAYRVRISLYVSAFLACTIFTQSISFDVAPADDCGQLSKHVVRLRAEYQEAARAAARADSNVGFDELTAILDKIVDAKRRMRSLGCGEKKKHPRNNF